MRNILDLDSEEAIYGMLKTLDGGRLSIAAMGLGLAQGAFEEALAYAKKRVQFSRPISKFQAIAFKLAEMDVRIELARNTLYKACWLKDQGKPYGRESAIAKLYAGKSRLPRYRSSWIFLAVR